MPYIIAGAAAAICRRGYTSIDDDYEKYTYQFIPLIRQKPNVSVNNDHQTNPSPLPLCKECHLYHVSDLTQTACYNCKTKTEQAKAYTEERKNLFQGSKPKKTK